MGGLAGGGGGGAAGVGEGAAAAAGGFLAVFAAEAPEEPDYGGEDY